jgi:hypothetical protein
LTDRKSQACLPDPTACFTKVHRQIHGNEVLKMLQFTKDEQDISPVWGN